MFRPRIPLMSYEVIARKYRPQTFSDVVGQSHLVTTLANAIRTGRVAHAYLFVGPRGTGKTSTARIFAKALNCEKGMSTEPCNVCDSCREITAGNSLDVMGGTGMWAAGDSVSFEVSYSTAAMPWPASLPGA